MLRIARIRISTFISVGKQEEHSFSQYQRLVALVKKHLSPVTASVFAQPVLQDKRDYVEWYSELQGQPEPLLSLPENQQLKVKELLTERLSSISKLAEQLPQLEPGNDDIQAILQKAVQFPGDKAIYVINDQPVIIFWGIADQTSHSVPPLTANIVNSEPPLAVPATKETSRSLLRVSLLLLSIVLLAGLFWLSKQQPINWQDYNPFVDEYRLLLDEVNAAENNCSALENIYNNNALINKTEEKFVFVKKQIEAKLADCEAYIQLKNEIESAQGDCSKLTDALNNNPYLQNPQKPFIELKGQLDTYQKSCKKEQLKLLPKVIEAQFVPGFATFIPETEERALEEIKKIGIFLSKHKDAAVLITLHTPVPGPEHIEHISIRSRSGFETTKDVLDARFNNVVDNLLEVPGVSRNQIKKGAYQFNKVSRIVKFKIISRSHQ